MDTHQLLRSLGIYRSLVGYHYLAYGLSLILMDEERLACVTKNLYPEIADHYGVSYASVEKALRYAVTRCWEYGNRDFLDQIAGFALYRKPTVAQFFDILAAYLMRHAEAV